MTAASTATATATAKLVEIPLDRRVATCRSNVETLAARGVDLGEALATWEQRTAGERWFASADGSVVRQRGNAADDAMTGEANHRTAVERSVDAAFPETAAAFRPPVTIEGLDPPWLALAIHRRTAAPFNGHTPAIRIVQADPGELLDGLATTDLRPMLADERVTVFCGLGAATWCREHLRDRRELDVTGQIARNPALRVGLEPPLGRIHAEADAEQAREAATLRGELQSIYAGRDKAWWRRRYDDATREDTADPLRVLVLSCRFTAYVRHANEDLADAFDRAGCRTRILVEPDDHHCLNGLAYTAAIRAFEPDLVVLVNYPRSSLPEDIPAAIPFVCWVQDAMPHQFEPAAWSAQGELDYVVGHLAGDWFGASGLTHERAFGFPVVASERKFHPGPIGSRERDRFACEIAFASRHAETPDELHARLVADWSRAGGPAAILEALRPRIREITEDKSDLRFNVRALESCRVVLAAHANAEPAAAAVSTVCRFYAKPLLDRIIRHQALGWCAEIADRHGWRLAIYGRGWDEHARFAPFARGELEHGDELRAAYRAATVHLHASAHVLLHQRVTECLLSGGLPVCRRRPEDAGRLRRALTRRLLHLADPDGVSPDGAHDLYDVANHAAALRCESQLQRIGRPMSVDGRICVPCRSGDEPEYRSPPPPRHDELDWTFIDLAETTFEDRGELEVIVRRAVERPRWRDGIAGAMAARARRVYTTAAFADRMLDFIKRDLASSSFESS